MDNETLFPIFELSGSPREIGQQHGKLAKKQLDVSISTYKEMFLDFSGITWEQARAYADTFIPSIEAYDPDIMEEIRGIAEGSGYDLEDILALNTRSEIILQSGQMGNGCTSAAFTPEVSETGETWIGQNWDWKLQQRQACVFLKIQQQNKPDISLLTEAGIVGKLGLNSRGIGVCLNALGSDLSVEGPVVPLHIVLRGILNSSTLSDVIQNVGRVSLACCANFLVASAEGQAITIEAGPGDFDVLYAEEGWIAHTNHFVCPRWQTIHDTGKMVFPDSFLRYGRIRQLIRQTLGQKKVDFEDIKRMFQDHVGYPDSICRHEDPMDTAQKCMGTVFSIVMNLNQLKIYITPGNPCETAYGLYEMESGI